MYSIRKLLLVLGFISCCLQAQGADKYTDENRPYEFGFKIDGEQHRHEKKDENGIIMGEFGFITADGVYHVTVYATDENGNFKILSMKNMRVKPYPTNAGAEKKGHSLPFPPSQNPPQTQGPARQAPGPPALQAPAPTTRAKTCSSCSIPAPKPGPKLTDIAVVAQNNQQQLYDPNSQFGQKPPGPQVYPTGQQDNPNYPQNAQTNSIQGSNRQQNNPNYAQQGQNGPQQGNQNYPQQGQSGFSQPPASYPQQDLLPPHQGGGGFGQGGQDGPGGQGRQGAQGGPGGQGAQGGPGGQGRQGGQGAQGGPGNQYSGQNPGSPGDRNPKRIDNYPQQSPGSNTDSQGSSPQKPILISAQMQIVDKSTDIYHKNPGEKDGLPQGLSKNDMVQLLYTFNYTVGFHAHFEEGYSDGSKQGYYYVTGRNGVRTRVDYVADEKGFRPKITEEVLDLLSDDVPKPETEKDEKFGLKGYEFKWLYYPEESKER